MFFECCLTVNFHLAFCHEKVPLSWLTLTWDGNNIFQAEISRKNITSQLRWDLSYFNQFKILDLLFNYSSKHSFFQAAIMSILLYGCTTWMLAKLEKRLDSNYTRMRWAILNRSWRQHPTKQQLYSHLLPITKTIQIDEPNM